MGYRIKDDEKFSDGIKRIAFEQIDQALEKLSAKKNVDESIHDARVCFKKLRALIRLLESELNDTFNLENKSYRDAGRKLSGVRDSTALLETLDKLTERFDQQLTGSAFSGLRRPINSSDSQKKRDKLAALTEAAAIVKTAKRRVKGWPIRHNSFAAISPGLQDTYKSGRKSFFKAYQKPTTENFHEWRKHVKNLRYQIQILRSLWPKVLTEEAKEIKKLGDYLSNIHDLAILRNRVLKDADQPDDDKAVEAAIALIDKRSAELETLAKTLGARIYLEKSGRFVARYKIYWNAWRDEVSARPIAAA